MGEATSCCIKAKEGYSGHQNIQSSSQFSLPPKKKKKEGYFEIILTPILTPQMQTTPSSRGQLFEKDQLKLGAPYVSTSIVEEQDQNEGQAENEEKKQDKNRKITLEDFDLLYILGKGAFCKVYLGCFREQGQQKSQMYAIKQMKKMEVKRKNLIENIKLQKNILKQFKSNFIARMHYAFRDQEYYYLVMEWAQGGDLYSFIKSGTKRRIIFRQAGQNAIRFIIGCIVLSLEYLHSHNIIYSDLKPENVLIFEDGYCKLTDFGVSKAIKKNEKITFKTGTRMYFAPQMVLGRQCKRHVDLWAMGVMAYELANLWLPFQLGDIGDKERFGKIVKDAQKNRLWRNRNVSQQLKDFVNKLLKFDPADRLGAKDWSSIKNHAFFKKKWFSWQKLQSKEMISPLLPIINQKVSYKRVGKGELNNFEIQQFDNRDKYETIPDWSQYNQNYPIDK